VLEAAAGVAHEEYPVAEDIPPAQLTHPTAYVVVEKRT